MAEIIRAESDWVNLTRSIWYDDDSVVTIPITQEEADEVEVQNQAVYDAADAKQQAIQVVLTPVDTTDTTEQLAGHIEAQRILILDLLGETSG